MPTLDSARLRKISLPVSTGWLLADCMEARGKQDLWLRQKPAVVKALRELAIIQSVESSNRIEGVTVAADRLRPLVIGHAKPRDRSEEELAGYRRGLDWIFTRTRPVAVTPAIIQHLHKLAQQGAGDAGKDRGPRFLYGLMANDRKVQFLGAAAAAGERFGDAHTGYGFELSIDAGLLLFDSLEVGPGVFAPGSQLSIR